MKPCANCGSTERYEREVDSRGGDGFDLLPIKLGFWKAAKFRVEVCGQCGLTQWFVPDRFLDKVKLEFPKMSN